MNADDLDWNEQLLELNRGNADSARLSEELEASLGRSIRGFLDGIREASAWAAETKAAPVEKAVGGDAPQTEPAAEFFCCRVCGNKLQMGARFCGTCGIPTALTGAAIPLEPACGACGEALSPGAKFCGACGQAAAT